MIGIRILVFVLINIPISLSLNCYSCSGTTGCNDPFNSLGSGVSTTGVNSANTYCIKRRYIDQYYRDGASTCSGYSYSSNAYQTCCQTDFCNKTTKISIHPSIVTFFIFILWIFHEI